MARIFKNKRSPNWCGLLHYFYLYRCNYGKGGKELPLYNAMNQQEQTLTYISSTGTNLCLRGRSTSLLHPYPDF